MTDGSWITWKKYASQSLCGIKHKNITIVDSLCGKKPKIKFKDKIINIQLLCCKQHFDLTSDTLFFQIISVCHIW